MARIRSVHPSMFTDEEFMHLTASEPLAALAYVGLWTEADDAGIFEWKPLTLKARVLSAASVDMPAVLNTLIAVGFVKQFSAFGKLYGAIRSFCKFQRPKNPKPIHPRTEQIDAYVRLDLASPGTASVSVPYEGGSASPSLPPDIGIAGEESPQMEDGGCRKEEEVSPSSLRSDDSGHDDGSRPARQIDDDPKREFFRLGKERLGASGSALGKIWKSFNSGGEALSVLRQTIQDIDADDRMTYLMGIVHSRERPNGSHLSARDRGDAW